MDQRSRSDEALMTPWQVLVVMVVLREVGKEGCTTLLLLLMVVRGQTSEQCVRECKVLVRGFSQQ